MLHRAELHPTKLELLAAWLPGRGWYRTQANADLVRVASFRFDDPDGAVGIETMLGIRTDRGPIHQVPLTYRDAPLLDGDDWLIGTAEHSVPGRRWVYDGSADPVYAAALTGAILTGGRQVDEYLEVNGRQRRSRPHTHTPPFAAIRHVLDDDPTLIVTDSLELAVVRRVGSSSGPPGAASNHATLTGTWHGQPTPLQMA